ncbi:hypothetical protein SMD44_08490 [Streptomyces alboflavus]|uniref:IrrE N-terminal-like domain-containing protein n=1 Tax=Streptomyces alboflavus TaxID=67267 RepID=A0A1Z1WRD1_9ACTN|nr:hypothetical protein [Streptomyces alboflavus]ARX89003.1 hypothetical protein SMD44_08490 [Streptomyces alboflavus]
MPTVGAPAVWCHTGRARVADVSHRVRSAVRKHRAWARARRRAIRIIHDDLGLRPGQGLQTLLDTVAHERGRAIVVQRLPLPSHISGFCVQGETEDTIVITANTSERQGLHVLLHELYHVLSSSPRPSTRTPSRPATSSNRTSSPSKCPRCPPTWSGRC